MEGRVTPDALETLSPSHAEIFEYAPESALSTVCGAWISRMLLWIFDTVSQGVRLSKWADLSCRRRPSPIRAEPIRPEPPRSEPRPAPVSKRPAPAPAPAAPEPLIPDPPPGTARRAAPNLLVATTTNGDRGNRSSRDLYGPLQAMRDRFEIAARFAQHASITREDDGFYINDLGAANGIWAGTDKVERERIENGAEYIIGDVLVSFAHS